MNRKITYNYGAVCWVWYNLIYIEYNLKIAIVPDQVPGLGPGISKADIHPVIGRGDTNKCFE